jgi:tetratricopeptide (TPR) repeat protein
MITAFNVIFTFIPKSYWIGLIFGLVLRLPGGDLVYSNIILSYIFLLIIVKLNVILHEIGHLTFAKIAGGKPRRMVLGRGHEVLRFKFYGTKIVINTPIRGGLAFATFGDLKNLRIRYFFYAAGGLFTNLLVALIVFFIFGFNLDKIDIPSLIILSNVLLVIFNLIPYRIDYLGIKLPNDGLSIFNLPSKNIKQIKSLLNADLLMDAYEFYELKEYQKAIEIYEKYLIEDTSQLIVNINLSLMYLKLGKFTESLILLKNIENSLEEKNNKPYKALVFNNLAWTYLIIGDIDSADKYSEMAFSINHKENSYKGTRGSVLIEKGEIDQGISQLINLVDFKYANNQTLPVAMYLCLGCFLKGDKKEENKYFEFVSANKSKLDKDDSHLWERIYQKINLLPITRSV